MSHFKSLFNTYLPSLIIFFFWTIINIGLFIAGLNYIWPFVLLTVSIWAFITQFIKEFKAVKRSYVEMSTRHLSQFKYDNWDIFIGDLKKFDKTILKKKNKLSEKDLDLLYWFKFIEDDAVRDSNISENKDLLLLNKEYNETNSLRLTDNIFGHAQEYINKHLDSDIDLIIRFSSMRIISFGIIFEKLLEYENRMLSNDFGMKDEIFQYGPAFISANGYGDFRKINGYVAFKLILTAAKARLFGAIKFALVSGIDKKSITQWYSNFEYDKNMIKGTNGLQRKILETINSSGNDHQDLDFIEKMKIIFDEEERVEIFELSQAERKKSPFWFKGPFYKKGGMVMSIFTNNSIKLNSIEKSIFSEIQFYSLLIEKCSNTLSREDFSTIPALVNMVKVVDAGTLWFESNNKDAYDKLFEQNLSIEPEKDKIRSENELFHISLDNDMPKDAEKVGVDWDETEDIGIVTNYKGKPYTGVCYSLHKNGGLEQYYMLKDGLKEGVGKEFYENGELSFWCLCKNDIITCAIEFENGLKCGDWVVVKNKDKMKRGYSKDKFFISFSELSEGKNFSLSYDDIKSGKYDEEIFNINRGMGFIFMNSGLINYYTKNSPHMWIPDTGLSDKDGKFYYPDLTLKQDPNPKLVNGIVYDVHFDGSIKCTAKFTDGLIDGETIYYDIGKF